MAWACVVSSSDTRQWLMSWCFYAPADFNWSSCHADISICSKHFFLNINLIQQGAISCVNEWVLPYVKNKRRAEGRAFRQKPASLICSVCNTTLSSVVLWCDLHCANTAPVTVLVAVPRSLQLAHLGLHLQFFCFLAWQREREHMRDMRDESSLIQQIKADWICSWQHDRRLPLFTSNSGPQHSFQFWPAVAYLQVGHTQICFAFFYTRVTLCCLK